VYIYIFFLILILHSVYRVYINKYILVLEYMYVHLTTIVKYLEGTNRNTRNFTSNVSGPQYKSNQ